MGKLVQGVGINDADYNVYKYEKIKGKSKLVWKCPYYKKWTKMLERAYDPLCHEKKPTYKGCSVCEEWLLFSNFKKWIDEQPHRDWESKGLDKDFLVEGNKVYSPETCVFIKKCINDFIVDCGASRGEYMIGVTKSADYFLSRCRDPFKRGSSYVGCYGTEIEAHNAWKNRKHQYALELAELEPDQRVQNILRTKYAEGTVHN